MKTAKSKKKWNKPQVKAIQLCCEATAYTDGE
jgi:hypothetical protein